MQMCNITNIIKEKISRWVICYENMACFHESYARQKATDVLLESGQKERNLYKSI